jgi:predicted acylesterase/phospholipase RssA
LNEIPDNKCRGLSLRGGGAKGSYEVGVLMSFLDNL